MFSRCKLHGPEALTIKAADLLENSKFYLLAPTKESYKQLLKKFHSFLQISREVLWTEQIYQDMLLRYEELSQNFPSA